MASFKMFTAKKDPRSSVHALGSQSGNADTGEAGFAQAAQDLTQTSDGLNLVEANRALRATRAARDAALAARTSPSK